MGEYLGRILRYRRAVLSTAQYDELYLAKCSLLSAQILPGIMATYEQGQFQHGPEKVQKGNEYVNFLVPVAFAHFEMTILPNTNITLNVIQKSHIVLERLKGTEGEIQYPATAEIHNPVPRLSLTDDHIHQIVQLLLLPQSSVTGHLPWGRQEVKNHHIPRKTKKTPPQGGEMNACICKGTSKGLPKRKSSCKMGL